MDEKKQEKQELARKPDYRGKLDVAAWVNKDKNGKKYISVKISNNVNLFESVEKEKKGI